MALINIGTSTTTVLQGLQYNGNGSNSITDIAALIALIRNDRINSHPRVPGALVAGGIYFLPDSRGYVALRRGDWVVVDPVSGWPNVVSNIAMGGSWVHS